MYLTRTFSDFKLKSKSNQKANKKLPRIDTAYLSIFEYERIRKNAHIPTKEELLNEAKIKEEQEYDKNAKARALKEKIIKYDKENPKIALSDIDLENLEKRNKLLAMAQKELDNNEDCVKEMEKLSLYAKIAHIREKQKKEHIELGNIYKKKEHKLDTIMEIKRIKKLKR